MAYDNTDSGVLFKNDKKSAKNSPEYKGKINVGGKNYWLAAWLKTDRNGNKFMSLAVTAMDGKPRQELENDIPF